MKNNKSIIIIGSGIAGLSTGCYAEMNGYNSQIFEKHNISGGLCTGWKRKGFTIDGCLHWVVGAGKNTNFYKIWKELGAIKDNVIFKDEFLRIIKDNKKLIVYTNIDELEKHLISIAPEDKKIIKKITKSVKIFAKYELPVNKTQEHYNIFDIIKLFTLHLPIIIQLIKYKNISMTQFAQQFKNEFLKEFFPKIFDLPNFSIAIAFFHLAWLYKKSSGYPIGGSLKFAKNITDRYHSLGGKINYNKNVTEIIIENNQAIGIKTSDGKSHYADIIISSMDGYTTLLKMISPENLPESTKLKFQSMETFPPLVQVSYGIKRNLKNKPSIVLYHLDNKITIGGIDNYMFKVDHNAYDHTMAPDGKSVLKVLFHTDYSFWKKLYTNKKKYNEEKNKIAQLLIPILEKYYPEISKQIEMIDIATPVTYKRYTGNHNGTWEGWLIDTKTIDIKMKDYIPKIKNFYMSGHWVEIGGGVPLVALSARNTIQVICKANNKIFKTTIE
ncbi:MAG: NAD(P)/FAD-dependent oxidoreductase [Spirochaetes bacterium]|nr:NAD(P)/FAD-dependent oxidoreductase [Spirochaetota bacterium]